MESCRALCVSSPRCPPLHDLFPLRTGCQATGTEGHWRPGCPGTFPIHKNVLLLPGHRRGRSSRKGRESPGLSKFLLVASVAVVLLSSMSAGLILLSPAPGCLDTAQLKSWVLRAKLCPGNATSITCVTLQATVPGGPCLVLPNAGQRIGTQSFPKALW